MEEDVIFEILVISVPIFEYDSEIEEIWRANYEEGEFIDKMYHVLKRRMIFGQRVFN